jgi:hypothetical protein
MVINPLWFATLENRLDTTIGMKNEDIQVWQCIRRAKADYEKNGNHGYYEPSDDKFMAWLKDIWGVEIAKAADGINFGIEHKIVSADKYTMFVLKYNV